MSEFTDRIRRECGIDEYGCLCISTMNCCGALPEVLERLEALDEVGSWGKALPAEQGWFWYRKNDRYHPVAMFVEDCGRGRFRAVQIYDKEFVFVDEADVEWWSKRIAMPEAS